VPLVIEFSSVTLIVPLVMELTFETVPLVNELIWVTSTVPLVIEFSSVTLIVPLVMELTFEIVPLVIESILSMVPKVVFSSPYSFTLRGK
ncbi:hypothetical protein, partial [uncultured Clostridium sp.]